MYLCKFDEAGKRIATVLKGVHFKTKAEKQKYLDEGYMETSDEDYAYYVGNKGTGKNGTGYVRGADGKPTDAPAYVPTKAEKLAELEMQYEADKQEIKGYLIDAILLDDNETVEELKQEMADIEVDYKTKREKIEKE